MKKKYTDPVSSSRNFMKIWIIHHSLCSNTVKKKIQQLWHLWIVLTENYKWGFCLTLLSQTNTISGKDYFKQWHTLGLLTRRNVFPEKRVRKHLIKNQVFFQSNRVGKNTDSCLTHFFYSTNVCFFLSPASLFFLFTFFFWFWSLMGMFVVTAKIKTVKIFVLVYFQSLKPKAFTHNFNEKLVKFGIVCIKQLIDWQFFTFESIFTLNRHQVSIDIRWNLAKSLQSCLTLWSYGLQPTRLLCPWDAYLGSKQYIVWLNK